MALMGGGGAGVQTRLHGAFSALCTQLVWRHGVQTSPDVVEVVELVVEEEDQVVLVVLQTKVMEMVLLEMVVLVQHPT